MADEGKKDPGLLCLAWLLQVTWLCEDSGGVPHNKTIKYHVDVVCVLSAGSTSKETLKAACKEDGSQKNTYKDANKAEAKWYSQ